MRFSCCLLLMLSLSVHADEWPGWRGPTHDNHAAKGATAPTEWSETAGIAWRTSVPGRGHSSPVLFGPRIYLTTCDEASETQSLLVFDRASGKLLTETPAHQGKLPQNIHGNNTHASPTVVCNDQRVYTLFNNDFAAWVTAFDLEGKRVWQQRVAEFNPQEYKFGFGSSPILVDGLLIVSSEYDGPESGVYAIDTATGKQVWKAPRPKRLSYSTPITAKLGGVKQLIMSGNRSVSSYDPSTGRQLWKTEAPSRATCGTMIWDTNLGLAFASGGYPDPFTIAVRTDGSGQVAWQNSVKCYEQSMLNKDGTIYAVADNGIAYCWRGDDGQQLWKERLRGPVSSSPLLVGDTIYVTNERGTTFVFAASPEGFQTIAVNQLGDESFATPAACDSRIYHRYADSSSGDRREFLIAIGD